MIRSFVFINLILFGFLQPCLAAKTEAELFSISMSFYRNGNFVQSAKLLENLLRQNPRKPLYWFNFGNCFFMLKKYEKAASSYKKTISLGGGLVSPAKLYLAKALKNLGKTAEASQLLRELESQNLPPSMNKEVQEELKTLNTVQDVEESALSSYRAGRYREAEELLIRNKDFLSREGEFLLSLVYIKLNKKADAERVLKNLIVNPQLTAENKSAATGLLKKLQRDELRNNPFWAFVDVSLGFTSNAYLDGKSVGPLTSAVTRWAFGGGYHFNQGGKWSEKISYLYNEESPQRAPELRARTHTLQTPVLFEKGAFDISLTPYLQRQYWDGIFASSKTGITSKVTYAGEKHDTGVDLDLSSQTAGDSAFSYLTGTSSSIRPYYGYWGAKLYTQIYWLSGRDGLRDISYSDGARLPQTNTYSGVGVKFIWKISDASSLAWDLSYIQRKYANLALPNNMQRSDSEFLNAVKLTYALRPRFLVYGLAEYANNSSTLGADDVRDKNYEASTLSLGFSWDAF